jgi:hypothetical protein
MKRTIALACVIAMLSTACGPILKGGALAVDKHEYVTLDKPADPDPTSVEVPYVPPPGAGEGTLVVDVIDATAKISLVTSTKRKALNVEGEGAVTGGVVTNVDLDTRLLCARTPCAVSLPVGSQTVHIEAPAGEGFESSTDLYDVDVIPGKPLQLTHIMSRRKTDRQLGQPARGLVADILLESFGWSFVAVGAPLMIIEDTRGVGAGLLISGAAMIVLGYVLYKPATGGHAKTTTRPSATTISSYPR